jgi:hypothetical protein
MLNPYPIFGPEERELIADAQRGLTELRHEAERFVIAATVFNVRDRKPSE